MTTCHSHCCKRKPPPLETYGREVSATFRETAGSATKQCGSTALTEGKSGALNDGENFRSRTARERRRRTSSRILDAVFAVIDAEGLEEVTVDRIRREARLSRGSFYNYAQTPHELLVQIARAVGNAIDAEQSALFSGVSNPVQRLSAYQRYAIARIGTDKACASILLRTLPITGALSSEMYARMAKDFAEAVEHGLMDVSGIDLALEMGMGMVIAMLRRTVISGVDQRLIEQQSQFVFQALGVSKKIASRLHTFAIPDLPIRPLRASVINGGLE
jgi:AcrR family transcriptional regulator